LGEINIKLKGFKEKYVIVCNSMRGKGDYKNGKIYKIWSLETDKIYIGSTCDSLTNRMSGHRTVYKQWKEGKRDITSSAVLFDLVGVENCEIEWVKDFPCETKKQLNKEEGRVMRQNKDLIVNRKLEGRSQKEYREDHKERIKEYRDEHKEQNKEYMKEYRDTHKEELKIKEKAFRDTHKEEINLKKSQKMTCECGSPYTFSNKSQHIRTKKHQNFITPL